MTGTGARHSTGQFSSGRITLSASRQSQDRTGSVSEQCQWCRLSLLGTSACGSGDTQHPVWGPDSCGGMAGRGERVAAGEMVRGGMTEPEASWQPWAQGTAGACKRMSEILFPGVWQCCCVFFTQHRPQRPLDLSCGELLLFSSLNL